MLQKSRKEEMIKDLEGAIKNSESLVFVNFHGLKVSDETNLRRSLRGEGVGYKVGRKTLLKRALEGKAEGVVFCYEFCCCCRNIINNKARRHYSFCE